MIYKIGYNSAHLYANLFHKMSFERAEGREYFDINFITIRARLIREIFYLFRIIRERNNFATVTVSCHVPKERTTMLRVAL